MAGCCRPGLLVGLVVLGTDRRLRVVLSADYQRLEFLRVLRSHELQPLTDPGALVAPPLLPSAPPAEVDGEAEAAAPPGAGRRRCRARRARAMPRAARTPMARAMAMIGFWRHRAWGYRALFLALALLLLFVRLLAAWAMRRARCPARICCCA